MAYFALKKDVFDISKVGVIGSPTITSDGVITSSANNNHVNVPCDSTKDFLFEIDYNDSNDGKYWWGYLFNGFLETYHYQKQGVFQINWRYPGSFVTMTNVDYVKGGKYHFWIKKENNDISIKVYINGELKTDTIFDITEYQNNSTFLNIANNNYIAQDSTQYHPVQIDLKTIKITQDGITFSPVKPAYLLERRKEGYDPSKFTVVGTPTITEYGVASGFSKGGHLTSPFILSEYTTFEIKITLDLPIEEPLYSSIVPFTMAIDGRNFIQLMFTKANLGTRFVLVSDFTNLDSSTVTNSWQYGEKNVEYSLGYDGTFYYFKKNGFLLKQFSVDYKVPTDNFTLYFGTAVNNFDWFFNGSIDLPSTSITVDGKEIFTGAKEQFYMLSV